VPATFITAELSSISTGGVTSFLSDYISASCSSPVSFTLSEEFKSSSSGILYRWVPAKTVALSCLF
jgi:hypothetical protein